MNREVTTTMRRKILRGARAARERLRGGRRRPPHMGGAVPAF
jgi:hypothetical protein